MMYIFETDKHTHILQIPLNFPTAEQITRLRTLLQIPEKITKIK